MQPRLPRDLRRLRSWPSECAWLSAKPPAIPRLKPLWGFERATLPPQISYVCGASFPPKETRREWAIALARAKSHRS